MKSNTENGLKKIQNPLQKNKLIKIKKDINVKASKILAYYEIIYRKSHKSDSKMLLQEK